MSKRKAPKEWKPPRTARASVHVERFGAAVRVDNVPLSESFNVLRYLLAGMRVLNKQAPEITPVLPEVGGGEPIIVVDDWFEGDRGKVGF